MTCKNCNTEVIGQFCHQCGQKSSTHRINFHEIAHDISHSVWHIDKGFLYTFIQLVKSPRTSIRGYLEGKRVPFFRPFAYLMITSAITLLTANIVVSITEKGAGNMRVEALRDELSKEYSVTDATAVTDSTIVTEEKSVGQKIGYFLAKTARKYLGFLLFGFVPVLAMFSFIIFRNSRYNYWEHLTAFTYIVGQVNVVFTLMTFVNIGSKQLVKFNSSWLQFSAMVDMSLILIWIVLVFYTYKVFYQKNKIAAFLKALLVPICALIVSVFLIGLFM